MEEWIQKIELLLPQVQLYVRSLEEKNSMLLGQVEALTHMLDKAQSEKQAYEQKYEALKVSQALLGSDEKRMEAKLKINSLIREIEQCIVQLSQDK